MFRNLSVSNQHNLSPLQQIRQQVMQKNQILQNLIPPTVTYNTQGNLIIIGAEDLVRLAASKLTQMHTVVLLANDAITNQDENYLESLMLATENLECFYNRIKNIKGFLGQFQINVENTTDEKKDINLSSVAIRKPHFDIILDLSIEPCLSIEMLPPGYFYVGHDKQKLNEAIEQIPDLVGEFDKPRYVKINSDVCAHYRNGINGCNRCLNFCPADAVKSINNAIEVDPYLCHGAGSCSSVCPTGAIGYDLPTSESLHSYLNNVINQFQQQAKVSPAILFHEQTTSSLITPLLIDNELAGNILPVELEEITVASIEHWMAALAWGASQLFILTTPSTAPTLLQLLEGEISLANRILTEIGISKSIHLIDDINALNACLIENQADEHIESADFSATSKRETLFAAIDHLNKQSGNIQSVLPMANIPYGSVSINENNCTLCLSCAATCPTSALTDGGDKPALMFTEQNCVQCGLCESACPEKVISLTPQINFNGEIRSKSRTLKEEKPFECIVCGAPFATQSMITQMVTKVGSHSAFNTNIERLKMCADCRVKDLFKDILKDPERQLR